MKATTPRKPSVPSKGLMRLWALLALPLMSCATYNAGAGCVTYRTYRPTVSVHDTAETLRSIDTLDVAMEAACQ